MYRAEKKKYRVDSAGINDHVQTVQEHRMHRRHLSSLPDGPYALPPSQLQQLVELLDAYGRPFILTSQSLASSLGLLHRVVLVCLKNTRGQVYLQKKTKTSAVYAGLWDVSAAGRIFAGESSEDAARRELAVQLGIGVTRLRNIGSLPYTDSTGANLSATFFLAGPCPAIPTPGSTSNGMFVDVFELQGLVEHQQSLLTPELIWAVKSGRISLGAEKFH